MVEVIVDWMVKIASDRQNYSLERTQPQREFVFKVSGRVAQIATVRHLNCR